MEIQDLTKYQSVALARGPGLRFEDTSSPVDPGDKGKVAEAVDVCFPAEVHYTSRHHLPPFPRILLWTAGQAEDLALMALNFTHRAF